MKASASDHSTIAPLYKKGFRDTLTRVSFRKMQSGSFTVEEYHE